MSDEPNTTPAQTADDTAASDAVADQAPAPGVTESAEGAAAPTADGAADKIDTPVDLPSGEAGDGGQATPPESYADFTLPEGMEVNAAALETAGPLLKEVGATQEQAQKFADWYAEQVQAAAEGQVEAFNQLVDGWAEESKNDSEFGGDKFDESIGVARAAIDKFGTPELKQLLETHGVGNHPEVIRFMVRVGKLTLEDVPGTGDAPSKPADRVSILYPNSA